MSLNGGMQFKASSHKKNKTEADQLPFPSGARQFPDKNSASTRRAPPPKAAESASACVGTYYDDWEYSSDDEQQILGKQVTVYPKTKTLMVNFAENISTEELRTILENAKAEEKMNVSKSKKETRSPEQKTKFREVTVGGVTFYRRAK